METEGTTSGGGCQNQARRRSLTVRGSILVGLSDDTPPTDTRANHGWDVTLPRNKKLTNYRLVEICFKMYYSFMPYGTFMYFMTCFEHN